MILLGKTILNEDHIVAITLDQDQPGKAVVSLADGRQQIHVPCSDAEFAAAVRGLGLTAADMDQAPAFSRMTEEELEAMEGLVDEGFLYLAKDKNGQVYAFAEKPLKRGAYWEDAEAGAPVMRVQGGFEGLRFADPEPCYLPRLLEGREESPC